MERASDERTPFNERPRMGRWMNSPYSQSKVVKTETIGHKILKWMVYCQCKAYGHNAMIEADKAGGTVDVFDNKTGVAYEIQNKISKKIMLEKQKTLKDVSVKEVIFLPVDKILTKDEIKLLKKVEEKVKEWIWP